MTTFDVTPQFSGALLGEPDYGAPGDFATFDHNGEVEKIGTHTFAPSSKTSNAQLITCQNSAVSSRAGLSTKNLHHGAFT
jgi:hypothetical protein